MAEHRLHFFWGDLPVRGGNFAWDKTSTSVLLCVHCGGSARYPGASSVNLSASAIKSSRSNSSHKGDRQSEVVGQAALGVPMNASMPNMPRSPTEK